MRGAISFWIEREEKIAYVNNACLRLLDAASTDQLLGHSPLALIHPESHHLASMRRAQLHFGLDSNPLLEKILARLDGALIESRSTEASFHDKASSPSWPCCATLRSVSSMTSWAVADRFENGLGTAH